MPLTALHGGAEGRRGCGAEVDAYTGDHLACPRTGLLPRRGFVVERAWVQVAREAVGPEGRVVPQQWLSRTTAPQVHPDDRRRLDFVGYGTTSHGEALCCDATLVSPLTRAGRPVPGADARAGVALVAARRRKVARYPELTRGGPQRLVVLAAEVGGMLCGRKKVRKKFCDRSHALSCARSTQTLHMTARCCVRDGVENVPS